MPYAAKRPCTYPGCGVLVVGGSRCEEHRRVATQRFADRERGTRQQRGYGAEWDRTRKRIMTRDGGICQPCLREGPLHQGHEVDHKIPKSQGGTDDDSNLEVICRRRHREKTAREAIAGARASAPRGGGG